MNQKERSSHIVRESTPPKVYRCFACYKSGMRIQNCKLQDFSNDQYQYLANLLLYPPKVFKIKYADDSEMCILEEYAYFLATNKNALDETLAIILDQLAKRRPEQTNQEIMNLVLKTDYHQEREVFFLCSIFESQQQMKTCEPKLYRINKSNNTIKMKSLGDILSMRVCYARFIPEIRYLYTFNKDLPPPPKLNIIVKEGGTGNTSDDNNIFQKQEPTTLEIGYMIK